MRLEDIYNYETDDNLYIGQVKLGKKNESGYPMSDGYFHFSEELDYYKDKQINELKIMCFSNDLNETLQIHLEKRDKDLRCRGDGKQAFNYDKNENQKCPCDQLSEKYSLEPYKCVTVGIFKFLTAEYGDIGYISMKLRGKSLRNSVNFIRKTKEKYKILKGIPIIIRIKIIESSDTNKDGNRIKVKYPILILKYAEEFVNVVMKLSQQNMIKDSENAIKYIKSNTKQIADEKQEKKLIEQPKLYTDNGLKYKIIETEKKNQKQIRFKIDNEERSIGIIKNDLEQFYTPNGYVRWDGNTWVKAKKDDWFDKVVSVVKEVTIK